MRRAFSVPGNDAWQTLPRRPQSNDYCTVEVVASLRTPSLAFEFRIAPTQLCLGILLGRRRKETAGPSLCATPPSARSQVGAKGDYCRYDWRCGDAASILAILAP